MMLRHSFDSGGGSDAVDNAVKQVLRDGFRTVISRRKTVCGRAKTLQGCQENGHSAIRQNLKTERRRIE